MSTMLPAPTSTDSPSRARIVRTWRATWFDLPAAERERLLDACYAIYREQTLTLSRDAFRHSFFSHPTTRVALYYGGDGELAGFSNLSVLTIDVDGRARAVFSAGTYIRLAYRGGDVGAIFGFTEALRQKLRAPLVPLAYLAMASNPAPYHLHTTTMPRLWPAPGKEPPAYVTSALRAVAELRGLVAVDGDPWRVQSYVQPREPERLRRSRRLAEHPSTRFFERRNPGWADPDAPTALLVWMPLDLTDIVRAVGRVLLRRINGR